MFVLQHFVQSIKYFPHIILFQFIVVKISNQTKLYLSQILKLKTINLFRPISMSWASEIFVAI